MSTFLQPHLHTYRFFELTSELSTFATLFLRYTSQHLGEHGGVYVSTALFAHILNFLAHIRVVNICNVVFEIYLQTPRRSQRWQRIHSLITTYSVFYFGMFPFFFFFNSLIFTHPKIWFWLRYTRYAVPPPMPKSVEAALGVGVGVGGWIKWE